MARELAFRPKQDLRGGKKKAAVSSGEEEVLRKYEQLRAKIESELAQEEQKFAKDRSSRREQLQSSFVQIKDQLKTLSNDVLPTIENSLAHKNNRLKLFRKRERDLDDLISRAKSSQQATKSLNDHSNHQAQELMKELKNLEK